MAGFIAPIISGLAGLFGGGKQQSTNQNTTFNKQNTQQTQGGTQNSNTFRANLDPSQQALIDQFSKSASDQLRNSTDLNPYTQGGLQQIGGAGAAASKGIANNLAARGLSFSPAAATAQTQGQLNTINQQQQFLQGIPLLQNQLQTQAQQNAEAALRSQPISTTSTGQSLTNGTTTGTESGNSNTQGALYGNPIGGAFSGVGAGLFGPNANGGSNIDDILKLFGGGK